MFFDGDYNMIRWVESQGYDVTYATSLDVQTSPSLMANRKVFLSAFYDEYWSKPMRDNVIAFRDQGKHLAFFDSNNVYWQIRFENSAVGVARDGPLYRALFRDGIEEDRTPARSRVSSIFAVSHRAQS